jgi:hypothetical protein
VNLKNARRNNKDIKFDVWNYFFTQRKHEARLSDTGQPGMTRKASDLLLMRAYKNEKNE